MSKNREKTPNGDAFDIEKFQITTPSSLTSTMLGNIARFASAASDTPKPYYISPEEKIRQLEEENAALKRTQEEILKTDPMTGAASMKGLEYEFGKEVNRIERGQSESLVIVGIDLNFFKKINDTYGHNAGDDVICEFTKRLSDKVRSSDTVCRKSGDEYIVLLGNTTVEKCTDHFINAIKAVCAKPIHSDNEKIRITASFGMAEYDEANGITSLKDVMKKADEKLYFMKENGRGLELYANKSEPVQSETAQSEPNVTPQKPPQPQPK